MKVNAKLLYQLREEKSWTQEELALAAGLNLRTIQRIEREASASLQSKKALAAAFDIDIRDLDYEEEVLMKRYEFKTIEIEPKEGFLSGIKRSDPPQFSEILREEGEAGWQLVQILTPDLAQGLWTMKTGRYMALMQREYLA